MNGLRAYEGESYAGMRVVTGFLFLWHGVQKLFGFPPLPPGVEVPGFVTGSGDRSSSWAARS